MIINKDAKTIQWEEIVFSVNGAGKTGYQQSKE
jgi:hypothetical protein